MARRLLTLAIVVAFVAPWTAPCLASAPLGLQMACCLAHASDAPVARPCCAPGGQPPATSDAGRLAIGHALEPLIVAAPFSLHIVTPSFAPGSTHVSPGTRLRSTVLLI